MKLNTDVILLAEFALQDVVSKLRDIGSLASVVVRFQIKLGGVKRILELLETFCLCARELKNSLFGISKCDQRAACAKCFDDTPLIHVRVLKFVQNDDWERGCNESSNFLGRVKELTHVVREDIKADATIFLSEPRPLLFFELTLLEPLAVRQL